MDVRVRVPPSSGAEVQILESPLQQAKSDFRTRLLQLLDHVTVLPLPILRGRINVNLAPAPVLKAIPGMDAGLAERIVSARGQTNAGSNSGRRQPVWLLFERIVDLPRMKALLPYLTCGGDVYRAQIVGFFDSQGPAARAEVVFDAHANAASACVCQRSKDPGTRLLLGDAGRRGVSSGWQEPAAGSGRFPRLEGEPTVVPLPPAIRHSLKRFSRFVEVLIGGRHALECGGLAPLWISNWPNRKRKRCQASALQNGYVCPGGSAVFRLR